MAYVSLYRKYRPRTFDDVVGQSHVIRTLVNAIEEDRLHHAYLFTGPRGTGKTSTARLLAKAINCELGPTPTPCDECGSCQDINGGTAVDVIELDMASHGGVEDARDLRDRALFAPARSRRKVYILDEVHMASTAAFNALLKLIEEPPPHVLFAMATTDPQKVLPTIMSRVQRLDLRRVSAPEVAGNVRKICDAEGYRIEDAAVDAIVRAGDGSLRDTQSILEQVLAFAGTEVTAAAVAQVLGQTPVERVIETVERLGQRDLAGLFAIVQGLLDDGHDLRRFTLDLVQHLRDLLVLQVAPDRPDLVDATDERRERLQQQTAVLPRAALLRAVDELAECLVEQRQGPPRLPLELTLARLAVPGATGDFAELSDRIALLESGQVGHSGQPSVVASGTTASAPTASGTTASAPTAGDAAPAGASPAGASPGGGGPGTSAAASSDVDSQVEPAPTASAEARPPIPDVSSEDPPASAEAPAESTSEPAASGDDLDRLLAGWSGVLELVKQRSRRSHALFEPATPVALSRGILTLRYGRRYASFHAVNATKSEFADVLIDAVKQATQMRIRLDVTVEGDDERRRPMPPAVTPADARTPVLNDTDDPVATLGPSADVGDGPARSDGASAAASEEDEVREAELDSERQLDPEAVEQLLVTELGAELVDEQRPGDPH